MIEENKNINPRSPVVVVLGHVDHGKTTLLDYIRRTNLVAKEAGGITQSIGAYEIEHKATNAEQLRRITFIDTPGHEAFIKMRTRGARAADLAILVVAADEGVKPQTLESIKILQETEIPFLVAITKIDKPSADAGKVKNELTSAGVLLEGYGGQISYQAVSANTGEGINELLDLLLLAADLENLTYDDKEPASGFILETKMTPRRGLEVSLILKGGILKRGDEVFTKTAKGKIKILENFLGQTIEELKPSAPALIVGFDTAPLIGEEFSTQPVAAAQEKESESPVQIPSGITPMDEDKVLKVILKADNSGSLEALVETIQAVPTQIPLRIIGSSIGEVNDNDIKMAIPSGGIVVAFKSKTNKSSESLARANNVKIISSEIIYELVKKVEEFSGQMENPEPIGVLEVLAVFNQENSQKQIIGGKVIKGAFKNKADLEIERGGETISRGKIINLQQGKKDAIEVKENNEAGILVNAGVLVKTGDKLIIR